MGSIIDMYASIGGKHFKYKKLFVLSMVMRFWLVSNLKSHAFDASIHGDRGAQEQCYGQFS